MNNPTNTNIKISIDDAVLFYKLCEQSAYIEGYAAYCACDTKSRSAHFKRRDDIKTTADLLLLKIKKVRKISPDLINEKEK